MGGCDKQGFPMKQGVLTPGRVRLLLHRGGWNLSAFCLGVWYYYSISKLHFRCMRIGGNLTSDHLTMSGQVPLASVDTEGAMVSAGGSLLEGALSALTSLFWTWWLWRRVRTIFLDWLTLRNQEWEVPRGLQRSASSSISPRRMMFANTSTPTADRSQPKLVCYST